MLNSYKIHLSSEMCFEQRQLFCIPDKAVQTEKSMEPRARATWNLVSNHCCAHFIWKFKYIKTMWVFLLLLFSHGNCPSLHSS